MSGLICQNWSVGFFWRWPVLLIISFYFQLAWTTLSRCLVAVLRLGVSFDRSRYLFSSFIGGSGSRDVTVDPAHTVSFRLLWVAVSLSHRFFFPNVFVFIEIDFITWIYWCVLYIWHGRMSAISRFIDWWRRRTATHWNCTGGKRNHRSELISCEVWSFETFEKKTKKNENYKTATKKSWNVEENFWKKMMTAHISGG